MISIAITEQLLSTTTLQVIADLNERLNLINSKLTKKIPQFHLNKEKGNMLDGILFRIEP